MRTAFIYAVIIGLWGVSGFCADESAPKSQPARATIKKVFHEEFPAKSPPRLMRDVIGSVPQGGMDWQAVVQRASEFREGETFLVMWSASAQEKLVIRFEYRQERADGVKMKEKVNPKLHGRTFFEVAGDEFKKDGIVTAWRVTILDGENVLANKQSFMW